MYVAAAVELGGPRQHDILLAKAQIYEPLFVLLGRFVDDGELPAWPGPAIVAVALGPSHDLCRRLLAGGDVDTDWALSELPEIAWHSLSRR